MKSVFGRCYLKRKGGSFKLKALVGMIFILPVAFYFLLDKPAVQAATVPTLFLDPATVATQNGQTFSLAGKLDPATDTTISSFELHVSFDKTKFRLDTITYNDVRFVTFTKFIDNTNGKGIVIIGLKPDETVYPPAAPKPITTVETIATFNFTTIAASGTASISYLPETSAWSAATGTSVNVLKATVPSQITIGTPPKTYGIADFTQLVIDWLQTKTSTADVNNDGKVNTRDLGIMMSNWSAN